MSPTITTPIPIPPDLHASVGMQTPTVDAWMASLARTDGGNLDSLLAQGGLWSLPLPPWSGSFGSSPPLVISAHPLVWALAAFTAIVFAAAAFHRSVTSPEARSRRAYHRNLWQAERAAEMRAERAVRVARDYAQREADRAAHAARRNEDVTP